LGIVPLKQLLERVKYSSDFHILISGGMLPEKMLFEILKDESSVQFEKYSSGMLPLRLLLPASKKSILFILEKDSGKLREQVRVQFHGGEISKNTQRLRYDSREHVGA
jgi:6-phosphogluconolactonase/glucosamine-6-phosphate isomerase/deaminase